MQELISLLVAAIATWRVTNMLVYETGPWFIFTKIRAKTGILHDEDGHPIGWPIGNMLKCFYCTSVWVAIVIYLWAPVQVQAILAISGVAIYAHERLSNG
jgi:Protein of unknown function (DUF1360)